MIANSVCDPGSHMALMIKFPVASWGCRTKWSETEPVLLNVRTWQSCRWERKKKRKESVETNLWNNSKIFLWSYSVETLKYFLAISVCICYLESTHCQIVLITGVSCETKHCEGDWSGSQASQSQFSLTGVSLLQQRRQLQNCDLQKIQPATI